MKFDNNRYYSSANVSGAEYHEGLRQYMLSIYNYMALALLVTGCVAMFAASSETIMRSLFNPDGSMSGMGWLVTIAPLGFILTLSFGIERLSLSTAQTIFWAYSATMGLSLSYIFLIYTGESIARVFFITSSVFGAMSLYGYTTKKDLTSLGSFLMMGLLGIIIAGIANLIFKSSALHFITSFLGVLIFTGLIAFETQRLKRLYFVLSANAEAQSKTAIIGALSLYLDFINLFISLLRFFGDRRD